MVREFVQLCAAGYGKAADVVVRSISHRGADRQEVAEESDKTVSVAIFACFK
jgi:hypothetical protein